LPRQLYRTRGSIKRGRLTRAKIVIETIPHDIKQKLDKDPHSL